MNNDSRRNVKTGMKTCDSSTKAPLPTAPPEVRSMHADDVDTLSLSWRNRYEPDEMQSMLRSFPGRSVWHPESQEFVLVNPWRHRAETVILAEIFSIRHVRPLLRGVFERCRTEGAKVVLTAEMQERQQPHFWAGVGLYHLETVIALALSPLRLRPSVADRLAFQRVMPGDTQAIDLLVRIDNNAFSWLWWNSKAEFESYLALSEVEVYLAMLGNQVVGYVGLTRYRGWGHLDRVAIAPEFQGKGLGREAVDFTIARGLELGFRSLSLSTQEENWQSRAVYRNAGFEHVRDNDYRLYGHWLVDDRTLPGPGNGVTLVSSSIPHRNERNPSGG